MLDLMLLLLIIVLWIYPTQEKKLEKLMTELSLGKQLISILLASLFHGHDLMCARGLNPSSPPNIYLLFSSFYMLYFNHMYICLHVHILVIG